MDAIGHVFAAKNAKLEHLFRSEFRSKIGMKISPRRLRQSIGVAALHEIVNDDSQMFHFSRVA